MGVQKATAKMSKHRNLALAFLLVLIRIQVGHGCRVSEFACRGPNGLCLPLDKYCDGKDDCGDGSDEPKFCTVCNRTYYGDVGRTYALRVPPPQWTRLPFLCHLTFTASGHDQGDIVQIIFDGFSVGRFDEGLVDGDGDTLDTSLSPSGELPGCPEGFMQLSELGRPFTGGSWCGSASGHQLYYSETATVTISVKVFHPPVQGNNPFEFRIRYKFISQSDAIVRYGAPSELLELGQVTPGTYCTRQFDECYRKKCRLQSPNYPGMYPRNVTCYWTIRQKTVPTCKHAMIGVSQESEHKALVKRSIASLNKTSRSVRAWSDCTGERDHLIFYDGSSTNDPVLAKYCGGDWLPRVVSRGSEMLVAFHSSPFSAPLQTATPNRGFELDVDILYTDSDSYDFAKGERTCEFHVNASNPDDVLMSRRGRMGRILSPRHTLPPNTTCTYYFHGYPTDLVWIYFTSYHLQILQPPVIDNTTFGQTDVPPWIIRFRVWDSSITATSGRNLPSGPTASTSTIPPNMRPFHPTMNSSVTGSYYYYPADQQPSPNDRRVNVDNAWNPVDNYIYGPTRSSVFNHNNPYGGGSVVPSPAPPAPNRFDKLNNGLSNIKETFNYIANTKYTHNQYSGAQLNNILQRQPETNTVISLDGFVGHPSSGGYKKPPSNRFMQQEKNAGGGRKLLLEIFDNETPKLCDHTALKEASGTTSKTRPCTPLESYVSAGNDLKIEFHTQTGTALYPATFALQYEFVDTNLGGDLWSGRRGEETPIPPLCSRVFRRRRGDFQSPRNVFLHGRGGARNLTCLYRFEAGLGERIRISLHNVSFGDSTTCITESNTHTGRPRCVGLENESESRLGELKIFDVPYKDVRVPLGCFCDNTSSIYNTPLTFQSNSRTLEISFVVTHLNVSEDFADVYFHASYEIIRVPDCRKRLRLKGPGGEDELEYPLRSHEASCEGQPWYIEAQLPERSLFVLTWGTFLPIEPNQEEILRCNTRNRLIIYSGRPLKVMRVICPTQQGNKASALHIFSEDWLNSQPLLYGAKPVSMVLEPVFKEPGGLAFSWLEIQRTKASLIQQLDLQTNFTANETLGEFGFFPRHAECEHKCPELDACIGSNLWCDGHVNCPSGYDESEEECGTARKLLELPGGIFAALGCIAAAVAACFIFCIFGLVRKRKKGVDAKPTLNGTLRKDFKKSDLFMDPGS
ncbi:uncharacterized protein LOC129804698 [Phlebotomus papatasi]|uniref:uncharacterized protein LOC129804698 n=1 Tax=Phlebotomus papatasi TaxID=29031 RepID=UPI0024845EDA|nr:uncharacterized protein LOC129804698 [Phlebotomus papatasi]